jgi:tRNA1(Val) A37 N6-methylase TrmN6
MQPAVAETATTVDAFLGGRVEAIQPSAGHHRSGLEAVLLAASLETRISGTVADLGAGVGVAGFCVAARCKRAKVVLVERDPTAIACARESLTRPANAAFAERVRIVSADIAASETDRATAGIGRDLAEHVILNPPFYLSAANSRSPEPARADAHVLGSGGLDAWFRAAASILKFGGELTAIFRAEGLDALLAAAGKRFGAFDILPIHPRPEAAAHRILVRAIKGSRAALRILPSLVLHDETGSAFRPTVEAILRDGRALSSAHRPWHQARGRPS